MSEYINKESLYQRLEEIEQEKKALKEDMKIDFKESKEMIKKQYKVQEDELKSEVKKIKKILKIAE